MPLLHGWRKVQVDKYKKVSFTDFCMLFVIIIHNSLGIYTYTYRYKNKYIQGFASELGGFLEDYEIIIFFVNCRSTKKKNTTYINI